MQSSKKRKNGKRKEKLQMRQFKVQFNIRDCLEQQTLAEQSDLVMNG